MTHTFYHRYARAILLLAACLVPPVFFGAAGTFRHASNDVRQWLPQGFEEARQYDWFLEKFGSEEVVVVSWPGCTVDDPRLDRMAAALTTGAVDAQGRPLFRSVLTGRQVLAELRGEPLQLSRSEALERLRGSLVGPDGRTSALIAGVSRHGAAQRPLALEAIFRAAEREAGLSRDELRLGGPTVDSVALDEESERSRSLLSVLSLVAALVLAWRCLRHVRLVVMVFCTALLCAGVSLAVVYFTGGMMNLVLIMMPPLIYVLSISGAIHLANYYQDAIADGDPDDAPWQAARAAWRPCLLAAGTTAVGLGSLAVSDVVPVKMFGIYSAAGVVLSVALLFLVLPAAMQTWPIRARRRPAEGDEPAPGSLRDRWSRATARFCIRHHGPIVAGAVGLMLLLTGGLWRLDTTVKVMSFFSPESRIIRDYAWLEEHLGPLVPVEVVVRFDADNPMPLVERLELIRAVAGRMESVEKVGGALSAATFAPPGPEGEGVGYMVQRRVLEEKLQNARRRFSELRYLNQTEDGGELWRVSARVEALNTLDYGRFVERLREAVDPLLAERGTWGSEAEEPVEAEVAATYTGIMPLLYKAQRELLNDLTSSFLTAFVLIGVAMVLLLGSLPAGLLSMLPNVFPAVLIFGGMGWMGLLVGIGSMMTASLALGIAVDDTIHFLSWFRRALQQGQSRHEAIMTAYRHCAGAMVQTSLICGVGLLVFAFSSFVPTARFAWLMFSLLAAALAGDLFLLPALLAGPFGRFFDPNHAQTAPAAGWTAWRRLWPQSGYKPVPAAEIPLE